MVVDLFNDNECDGLRIGDGGVNAKRARDPSTSRKGVLCMVHSRVNHKDLMMWRLCPRAS